MRRAGYGEPGIRRAERSRRRRITRVVLLLTLVLTCIFFTGIIAIAGIRQNTPHIYKYYTSIEVQPGDTLWAIARDRYLENGYDDIRDYISELRHLNHITGDDLTAGSRLIITYYSTEYR